MRIGFVGAGTIGEHMADRINQAGLALEVCDIRADVRERYAARGIPATHEAQALCGCDCVVVMVATERQLEDVVFGARGLATALDPQAPLLLIVMSTVLPATMHALRDRLAATKVRLLDAPVSGGPARAERGTLTIMVGGTEADYEAGLPVLRAMGDPIFYCGALGTGSLTKLVNNVLGVSNLYLAAEAYALALELGGDLTRMLPVLEAGTGRNFTSTGLEDARAFYAKFLDPPRGFDALLEVTTKDLQLIAELARHAGSALPVLDGVATGLAAMRDQAVGAAILEQWKAIGASATGRKRR